MSQTLGTLLSYPVYLHTLQRLLERRDDIITCRQADMAGVNPHLVVAPERPTYVLHNTLKRLRGVLEVNPEGYTVGLTLPTNLDIAWA